MRKIFTLLLALTATLTAWSSTGVTINGISYILAGDTATVIADSYSGSVTIPSTVTYSGTTYRVTSIGKQAFASCRGLTSVTIGNSVTSIAYGAFASCTALTSITIPNSVTSIGNSAFYNCPGLTSVTLGNSVDSIGSNAFYECTSLTSITIPNSVTSIDGSAFSGCSGLTSITVDSNNTTYDSRNNCNAIIETASNTLIAGCKNTVIPNSVDSIGVIAFSGCTSLSSITLGNSVDSIGALHSPAAPASPPSLSPIASLL